MGDKIFALKTVFMYAFIVHTTSDLLGFIVYM